MLSGARGGGTPTALRGRLTDVVEEVFTVEVVPESVVEDPGAVLALLVAVAPVVRLTRLPPPAGHQQGATTRFKGG